MDKNRAGKRIFSSKLNSKYTFESFVVGQCNLAAFEAARSIVFLPTHKYNPVYIHGPTGVGKTHLLHAAGNYLASLHANMNVALISCELFAGLLVEEIRDRDINTFIDLFYAVDFLMVDDLHYLDGKDRTQEEVSYAIKSFIASGKQVLLSSDCPPQALASLGMGSFKKGISVLVKELDFETRLGILKKKVEEKQYTLSDDMLSLIAGKCGGGAFELEGILNRLIAISSMERRPFTLEVINETVRLFCGLKSN